MEIINRLHSQEGNYLDFCLGTLIGIGGTNEYSAIGMIAWTAINWRINCAREKVCSNIWQSLIIACITTLCLCFYSFNEIPGDTSGLTTVEFLKVVIWGIFSLTLIRSEERKLYAVVNGVSLGLWFYTLMILSGSLIVQPFQSARGMMYNILSNELNASSSITSYTCANSALIFLGTKNWLALPTSLSCIVLGIHSLNRISLAVGASVIIYLSLSKAYAYSKQAEQWGKLKGNTSITILLVIISIIGLIVVRDAASGFVLSSINSVDIAARMQNIEDDPRYYLYSAGFRILGTSIAENNLALLLNTNEAVSSIYPDWSSRFSERGWHSLVLDSARGAGWIGLFMASAWLTGLGYSAIHAAVNRNSRYILMGTMQIFILLTSMPVALGHYELLGTLTLTTLLISSPRTHGNQSLQKEGNTLGGSDTD
jgi:hypothetical protein